MGASDDRERLILDSQFGAGATSFAPATWYVGLSRATSNDDGTGFDEPTIGVNGYARVALTNNTTNWPAAATVDGITTKRNGVAATFPTPTGPLGTMVEYGLFIAATGGTPQWTNPLDNPVTVQSGNTPFELAANQIVLSAD